MIDERTPKSSPGPFYVLKDRCITCGAPEAEAPDLLAFDERETSCYFRRQPITPDETYRAMRAVRVSCCEAVRYGGTDPDIMARLAPSARVRNHVTFRGPYSECSPADFLAVVLAAMTRSIPGSILTSVLSAKGCATFTCSWNARVAGVTIDIVVVEGSVDRWRISVGPRESPAVTSIAIAIDDALAADGRALERRWFPFEPIDANDWSALPF